MLGASASQWRRSTAQVKLSDEPVSLMTGMEGAFMSAEEEAQHAHKGEEFEEGDGDEDDRNVDEDDLEVSNERPKCTESEVGGHQGD